MSAVFSELKPLENFSITHYEVMAYNIWSNI